MTLALRNTVQLAGVTDRAEAAMMADAGVDFIGFPLRLAVHEDDISEDKAQEIIKRIEPPPHAVLITYLSRSTDIASLCRTLTVSVVQLHGEISTEELIALRTLEPQLCVIKSLIVADGSEARLRLGVEELSPFVHAFITDTFDPVTGATGATGKTHDWSISRELVEHTDTPVWLAGGLTPENVGDAVDRVRPAGVDAHTGVEDARGRKDPDKVRRFVAEAKSAFERMSAP